MKLKIKDIGLTIAERQLEGCKNGIVGRITVRIGKPFPDESSDGCWYCPYSITAGNDQRLFYGAGVDSVQALCIAIAMINTDLKNRYSDLSLTWMGETDLGFGGDA
jgi:hypothetical protein